MNKIKYISELIFYKSYILIKLKRQISKKSSYKSTKKLELIFSNILGPINPISL